MLVFQANEIGGHVVHGHNSLFYLAAHLAMVTQCVTLIAWFQTVKD